MKKDTIIGISLIAIILIGFNVYNSRQHKAQVELKRVQDSITNASIVAEAKLRAEQAATLGTTTEQAGVVNALPTYSNTHLEEAMHSEPKFYTLENDVLKIDFTTLGAQVSNVLIKEYYTYDSLALNLVKHGASDFNIQLFTPSQVNTSDLNYVLNHQDKNSIEFRLFFDQDSYLEHKYILVDGSYMLDFKINLVNMQDFIPRNITGVDASWNLDLPRLEKGYKNEKNYSTVAFRYPDESTVEDLGLRKDSGSEEITTSLNWFAFQQQFFSAIFLAENNFESADLAFKFFPETNKDRMLMACESNVHIPIDVLSQEPIDLKFYFGPNHYKTLQSYDYKFEEIVPLGNWIVRWINRWVIIPVFDFLNNYIASYGLIILLLTILVKLVISPLTIKSYLSSAKMRVLKPEVDKINAKYPNQSDAMKKQQEIMALYKSTGVSMFGGCLPMLIQFPILIAMFRFFPASFELRQQSFLWAKDLSTYDSIWDYGVNIPFYGDHVSLFALLMAISMFFYSRMNQTQMDTTQPGMGGMKFMMVWMMPVMMLFVCNNFSAGLSYYYMLSNVFTIIQTWAIRKYFVDEDKIYAKLKANSAKSAAKPKSKMQQRLEAISKAQQEAARQRKK